MPFSVKFIIFGLMCNFQLNVQFAQSNNQRIFVSASTSHQSEENLPSSTTQEHKTPSQKEEADDSVVVKAKNPYSIDAILRTPTAATGGATSASANSSSSSIKNYFEIGRRMKKNKC